MELLRLFFSSEINIERFGRAFLQVLNGIVVSIVTIHHFAYPETQTSGDHRIADFYDTRIR